MKNLSILSRIFLASLSLFAVSDGSGRFSEPYLGLSLGASQAVEESLDEDSTLLVFAGYGSGRYNHKALKLKEDGKYYICPLKIAYDIKDKTEKEISAEIAKDILQIISKEVLLATDEASYGFDGITGEFYVKIDGKIKSARTWCPSKESLPYLLWLLASDDVPKVRNIEAIKSYYKNDPRRKTTKEGAKNAARIKYLESKEYELMYNYAVDLHRLAICDSFKDKSILAVIVAYGAVHETYKVLAFKDDKYYIYPLNFSEKESVDKSEISEKMAKELLEVFAKEISLASLTGSLWRMDAYRQSIYLRVGENIEHGAAKSYDKNSMPYILYKMLVKDTPSAEDFFAVRNFYKGDMRLPSLVKEKPIKIENKANSPTPNIPVLSPEEIKRLRAREKELDEVGDELKKLKAEERKARASNAK